MTTETDLPGMLALAKGVAEQKWPHTMDAQVWVAEWMKMLGEHPEGAQVCLDPAMMIAWFANAIMAGHDTASSRASGRRLSELRWALVAIVQTLHQANPDDPSAWHIKPGNHAVFSEGVRLAHRALESKEPDSQDAEALARRFHETYERLAPSLGYETRLDTRDFEPTSKNGRLMVAVCAELLRG